MTINLNNQWPIFAPINISFNKEQLYQEIINSKILDKGNIATSHLFNGKNYWDNSTNFNDEKFKKLKNVPLWTNEDHVELSRHEINTFYQVNLTTFSEDNLKTVWEGTFQNKNKIPLWIKYDYQWRYRSDVQLPYLESVVDSLGLDYFSMIRIVYQRPPSIGLVHKDSGINTNTEYYNQGGVNITLNVSSGGANLFFLDKEGKERHIDEANTLAWHFNDSTIHCTSEVTLPRIQIRIYGKHSNYTSLMNLSQSI
jgi:hypothetical protein